jgi:hypothetical protein
MPEGFEKQASPQDLTNLLEFLTAKGPYLPLDLRKVATICSTTSMFYGGNPSERLVLEDWSPRQIHGVPFLLVDPQGDRAANVILLYGPNGRYPPEMPRQVRLPVHAKGKKVHLLSGVGGWSWPSRKDQSVSLIVRLHYADGSTEDHPLKNGVHFADYIRRIDVPESEFAFAAGTQQMRYLAVPINRPDAEIAELELVKGDDASAPIVMGVTVETR